MPEPTHHVRRKELDKEMSSYISTRRKKSRKGIRGILKSLKGKKKNDVDLHPEVETYGGHHKTEEVKNKEDSESADEVDDEYQENSERKGFFATIKSWFVADSINHEEEFEESEEEIIKEPIEEEPQSEMEEDYQEEVVKVGWFSRLMGKIFVKTQEEEEFEEVSDELAEDFQDMKAIAEITTKVMKMLPKEKLAELKESEDFQTFKEILKKRELIK